VVQRRCAAAAAAGALAEKYKKMQNKKSKIKKETFEPLHSSNQAS